MSDHPPAVPRPASSPSGFALERPFVPLTLERVRHLFASRYDVLGELGAGGSAIVYLAHDRASDRRIAVKVLRPELSAAVIAARFLREIEIGKRLTHPNILSVEEWGTVEGELYCTMPFVDGETLQQRMARETHLPLAETLRIARAVADALDCAHSAGLIHRDIKPGNILLSGNQVFVADFGIARAMTVAATSGLTETGLVIGTAAYMSPEQGSAEKSLDGRTDIYSLGCVVYEMLGGEPPFTGPTARAIIARHAQEAPRSLRVIRPGVPLALQRAVEKALAKVPADRFATAGAFAAALDAAATRPDRAGPWWRHAVAGMRGHPVLLTFAIAAIIGAGLWSGSQARASRQAASLAMLDTTRYAVIAVDTTEPTRTAATAIRAALQDWTGITVVEPASGVERQVKQGAFATSDSAARAIATTERVGRVVRVEATATGDSVRVYGRLIDTRGTATISDAAARGGNVTDQRGAMATDLVERLLFPNALGASTSRSDVGTRSVPARQAYLRGQAAVGNWMLDAADSAFRRATALDPRYAAAALWLAQVRQWNSVPVSQWQFAADQALANAPALSRPARAMAEALAELARGRREQACARWSHMTRTDGEEFVAWYSLGNCLRYDSVVVRDPRSRSGWSFRTSYQAAINAYEEAFTRFPPEGGSLSDVWFRDVRDLLGAAGIRLRPGRAAPPDTGSFLAVPMRIGDSISYTPDPLARFYAGRDERSQAERDATASGRQRLLELTRMWRTRSPASTIAKEAVAVALDLLGNRSALDTLSAIRRSIPPESEERTRLAVLEVWLRVKHSIPDDVVGLRIARALADSVLRNAGPAGIHARELAGLAALTGRAATAAHYASMGGLGSVPTGFENIAPSLLTYSAVGGPRDSIREYGVAFTAALERSLSTQDRAHMRARWLVRAASLAAPDTELNKSLRLESRENLLDQLLEAWRRRDRTAATALVLGLRRHRTDTGVRPQDVSLDLVYTEAAILAALGDTTNALAWLEPALTHVAGTSTDTFADLTRAAALVRAMALRAELAGAAGDVVTARRWALPALMLWSDADGELRPTIERLRTLTER